jgi:hypothetical protein
MRTLAEHRSKRRAAVISLETVRKVRQGSARIVPVMHGDIIQAMNAAVGQHLGLRDQKVNVHLEITREALNENDPRLIGFLAAAVCEVADLSMRGTTIEVRVNASSISISGRNPIDLPSAELQLDATVTDCAEAIRMPVRMAWEQCVGPQLVIETTPGGFKFSRMYWLVGHTA